MHKFVAKFPSVYGWQEDMITGATIAQLLQKQLLAGGFSEIVPRTADGTLAATFRAHSDVVDAIFRMSRTDAVFYKLHDSEHIRPDLELLWLPEDASLDWAFPYRKETGVFGIALKNAAIQPLRFMSQDALQKFVAEKHIADLSRLGRWKLHGVPSYAGPVPVYAILEQSGRRMKFCISLPSIASFWQNPKGMIPQCALLTTFTASSWDLRLSVLLL